MSKCNVGLKSLLLQGLSEPEFYGDLMYKFKKILDESNGRTKCDNFSIKLKKLINRYRRIGYNINVMRHTACLVFNPETVGDFAFLFNCTPVGRTSDLMTVPT